MKERNYNLDILRIIACVGVVILHFINGTSSDIPSQVIYYFGTISIPLFFLISGYFMINHYEGAQDTQKIYKKILNIFCFIGIWSLIIGLLLTIKNKEILMPLKIFGGVFIQKEFLRLLWFLISLAIVYFLTPMLRNIKNKKRFLIILTIVSSLIFISNHFLKIHLNTDIDQLIFQPYRLWTWIYYYFLGGYLKNIKFKKTNITKLLLITSISIAYEYFMSKYFIYNSYAELFYDSILIKVWVIETYKFVMSIKINNKDVIELLSSLTFSVYLLQIFLLYIVDKIHIEHIWYFNIIETILSIIVLFACSYIISKTKYIKKIFNLKIIK